MYGVTLPAMARNSSFDIGSFRKSAHASRGGIPPPRSAPTETMTPDYNLPMCRNIKTLANFCPPATDDEVRASALQFVRKLSGMNKPSRANEAVFNRAVEQVTAVARELVASIVTTAPPRNREEEAQKARERARVRFA